VDGFVPKVVPVANAAVDSVVIGTVGHYTDPNKKRRSSYGEKTMQVRQNQSRQMPKAGKEIINEEVSYDRRSET